MDPDADADTPEERMLAQATADQIAVPVLDNATPGEPYRVLEELASALAEEDEMDQATFNAMLKVALASFAQDSGEGVSIQSPAGDIDLTPEAALIVNAASAQIVGASGGVSIGGSSVALLDGDGLAASDRPVIATQVGTVAPAAFNDLRDGLIAVGLVIDGD